MDRAVNRVHFDDRSEMFGPVQLLLAFRQIGRRLYRRNIPRKNVGDRISAIMEFSASQLSTSSAQNTYYNYDSSMAVAKLSEASTMSARFLGVTAGTASLNWSEKVERAFR
jgi:hypothetical protein